MNNAYYAFIGTLAAILIVLMFYCIYLLGGSDARFENILTNMEQQNKINELEDRLRYNYRIELDNDSIRVYDNVTNKVIYTEPSTTPRPSALQIALIKDNE